MIAMTHINKVTTFCTIVITALFIAGNPQSVSAQTNTAGGAVHQGFNALDHRLQRPLPNEHFEHKRFGDHLFISAEAAPTLTHRSYGQLFGTPDLGARGGVSIGDWFTPVHGLKLGLNMGARTESGAAKHLFAGVSIDYLMNLSSLAHMYKPDRKFEFITVIGAEYQRRFRRGSANVFGGHIGLQTRFNITPSTFLYLEPRINLFTDEVNSRKNWQKYDWEGALLVGLGYRISPITPRFRTRLDNKYALDNTFYGFNAGANLLADSGIKTPKSALGANASMYIGTWASTISGWRFMATAGAFGLKNSGHPKFATAEIDYLLNINSIINGFNPENRFNTNFIIGPAVGVTSRTSSKLHLGGAFGVQGVINLTDNLQFVIEPKAFVFRQDFATSGRRLNVIGSFNLGFQYRLGRYKDKLVNYDFSTATEDFLAANNYFLTFGAGAILRDNKLLKNQLTGRLGFGRWFSPVSAWRIVADGDVIQPKPSFYDITLNADYMLSLTNMFCNYNPDRVFDLVVTAGPHGGIARYNGKLNPVIGAQSSIQAKFNLSDRIDLFVEPGLKVTYAKGFSRSLDKGMRVLAGFNYKFGNRTKRTLTPSTPGEIVTPGSDDKAFANYVTVTGGPGIFSKGQRLPGVSLLCGGFDIVYGRKFSNVSSVQAGIGYDFPRITNIHQIGIGNIHADYVINVLNLIDSNPERIFHINLLAGVGFGWSNYPRSSIGLVAQGGLQLKWNVSKTIDIIAEPRATLWQPRVCLLSPNKEHFVGAGKVMVGVSYKF